MTISEYKQLDPVSESKIQQAIIREFARRWPKIYATGALFAVPNQGKRGKATASRMKSEGMVAGVSDLILLWPSNGYHGAVLEMKIPGKKPSAGQCEWLMHREASGYMAAFEDSVEGGIRFFSDYLNNKKYTNK